MSSLTRLFLKIAALYIRRFPDHAGRWRLERRLIRLSPVLRGHLTARVVKTRLGFSMLVDGDSQAARMVYLTGRYEEPIASLIQRLCAAGDWVVDGGAHIGFFTLLAARHVGPTGRVIAFEPTPQTAVRLAANLSLNGFRNVTLHRQALSSGSGRGTLSLHSASDTGQATLRPLSAASQHEPAQLVALDDVLLANQVVRLIKLDLEGAELAALLGMRRILTACTPHLVVEVTDEFLRRMHGLAAELYDYLAGFGYTAYVIEPSGLRRLNGRQEFVGVDDQFNALFTIDPTVEGPA